MKKIILILLLLSLINGCAKQEPQFLIGSETLEIEILSTSGSPLNNIEVDLWKKDTLNGPPDAGFLITNEQGLAIFNVPEGEYKIGFNLDNFPKNLVYPEKESVIVTKGIIAKKKIILNVKATTN